MTHQSEHTLDQPHHQQKLSGLRILCLILIVGLFMVNILAVMVVQLALGGRPLLENGARLAGLPVLNIISGAICFIAVVGSFLLPSMLRRRGLQVIATTSIPLPEPGAPAQDDTSRVLDVFAQGKFVQFALLEGTAMVATIFYHLSSDWILLSFVGVMLALMITLFPSSLSARNWFESAWSELQKLRTRDQE